jgi:GT2 family glycosyltransferase
MIAVIVASLSRPEVVGRLVRELEKQTRLPDQLVLSVCEHSDLPPHLSDAGWAPKFPMKILFGKRGLTVQRNHGLEFLLDDPEMAANRPDIVVFFDDDFVMRNDWLECVEREMANNPHVVGYTGLVLADGAPLAGYSADDGLEILAVGTPILPTTDWRMRSGETEALYGCNMAVRASTIRDVRFDEALIMYGWLEDHDFSIRLGRHGTLQRSPLLYGVHLGWKSGRGSGTMMGYSQIANPIYLYKKRILSLGGATKYVFRNFSANVVKSVKPERFTDRRGRLFGNMLAFRDLLLNRISPSRISEL